MDNKLKVEYLENQLRLKEEYIKSLEEMIERRSSPYFSVGGNGRFAGLEMNPDDEELIGFALRAIQGYVFLDMDPKIMEEKRLETGDDNFPESFYGNREEQIVKLICMVALSLKESLNSPVQLTNQQLMDLMDVKSNDTMINARNNLVTLGVIDYVRKGRKSPGTYRIIVDLSSLES